MNERYCWCQDFSDQDVVLDEQRKTLGTQNEDAGEQVDYYLNTVC